MARKPSGNHWSVSIEVDGLSERLAQLREFDRVAYDRAVQELEQGAQGVADWAANNTPDNGLSNWGAWSSASQVRRTGSGTVVVQRGGGIGGRDLAFNATSVKAGYRPKVGRKFRKGQLLSTRVVVEQASPAGAIYELAGSTTVDWGAIGGSKTFKANLNDKRGSGPWPRILNPAYYAAGGEAADRIEAVVARLSDDYSTD